MGPQKRGTIQKSLLRERTKVTRDKDRLVTSIENPVEAGTHTFVMEPNFMVVQFFFS